MATIPGSALSQSDALTRSDVEALAQGAAEQAARGKIRQMTVDSLRCDSILQDMLKRPSVREDPVVYATLQRKSRHTGVLADKLAKKLSKPEQAAERKRGHDIYNESNDPVGEGLKCNKTMQEITAMLNQPF